MELSAQLLEHLENQAASLLANILEGSVLISRRLLHPTLGTLFVRVHRRTEAVMETSSQMKFALGKI